jgi:uncharacterized RDD family membrane protein YckC
MSYPPGPNNPYGQPQQPPQGGGNPYANPQNPPNQPQQPPADQPAYGYPQTPGGQPGYGYPQQPPAGAGYQDPNAYPGGYGGPGGYGQPGGYPPPTQPPAPGQAVPSGEYGHWGLQVGAYLLDGLIFGLVPVIFYIIGAAMQASAQTCTLDSGFNQTCSGSSPGGLIMIVIGAVLAIAAFLLMCYREGTTGQTPGKKALGIMVVRETTGQPLGFGLAIGRKICHILDGVICDIGYLWPIWDQKKQTFADKIVGSVVVRTR